MPRASSLPLALTALFALAGCSETLPAGPEDPSPSPPGDPGGNPADVPRGQAPASIIYVSGDRQEAKTYEDVGNLVVRVEDARGIRVEGVQVNWTVPKGGARVADPTYTDENGEASTTLKGSYMIGESTVEARVDGVAALVRFTMLTTTMVIEIWNLGFSVPGYGTDFPATVPAHTPIEFLNRTSVAHVIREVSRPAGGSPLQSPELGPGGLYRFVPNVAGTWTYECDLHPGETGSIVVP